MRKNGFILLGVLAAIFFIFMWAFSDKIVEKNLERIGTKIVGARVELSGVKFYPFKLKIQWKNLKITNPDNPFENIIETGSSDFELSPGPLVKRKFIINSFKITGIQFHTERKISGRVKRRLKQKKEISNKKKKNKIVSGIKAKVEEEKSKIPIFNLDKYLAVIDTKAILDEYKPKTAGKVENLIKEEATNIAEYSKEIQEIGKNIDLLVKNSEKLKDKINVIDQKADLGTLEEDINEIDSLLKELNGIEAKLNEIQKNFNKDYNSMSKKLSMIDIWLRDDYNFLVDKLKIPDTDKINISQILFGKKVVRDIDRIKNVIQRIRIVLFKAKNFIPRKRLPKRLEGEDIIFVHERELPNLWIKNIFIGGKTKEGLTLSGSVSNLVSNQKLIGMPTSIKIKGHGIGEENSLLTGRLDYLGISPAEKFNFVYDNFPVKSIKSSNASLLPLNIKAKRGSLNASLNFKGEDFFSRIIFKEYGVSFDFLNDKVDKFSKTTRNLIEEIFSDVDKISVVATVKSIEKNTTLSINSNIDSLFSKRFKKILLRKKKEAIQDINNYIKKRGTNYKSKYRAFLKEKSEQFKGDLNLKKSTLLNLKQNLIGERHSLNNRYKEIEAKLKKKAMKEYRKKKSEIENKAKKKATSVEKEVKNKLKSLF